jgi:SAM-dependent methyltransferase
MEGLLKFLGILTIALCINYIVYVTYDRLKEKRAIEESFQDQNAKEEDQAEKESKKETTHTWITDPQLFYDAFYADIYDQLCNQKQRTHAKIAILEKIWGKTPVQSWSVLDLGCGTGHATTALAKLGAGRVIGMDYSKAMLEYAQKVVVPAAELTKQQSEAIEWRSDTIINPSSCSAGEFNHIICFYFTLYYIQDQEEFFRFMNLWAAPGGKLCVEVVNKYKFDPILESASPFVAFSVQKYSKERIMKSKVTFNNFEYEANFELTDPEAEFFETFRFKNGHVRRQKHRFYMPTITQVVEYAKRAGWKYVGYQDLQSVGFEYSYLLTFEKT